MFDKLINNVGEKYRKFQEENLLYKNMLDKTDILSDLNQVPLIDRKNITISYKEILEICPDLNDNKALLIRGLLPIDEVYLTVMYGKECKSNKEYFLVPTNKCLWIINTINYTKISYDSLNVSVIKNNIMSKVLNISNILFLVNGNEEKITNFIKIINDLEYRENLSSSLISKFCGISPRLSLINDIGSGISLDDNKNIVFHTKNFNYKYNINDIKNYELMLDDIVVSEKRSNRRVRMTANKNSCYQMNIRVTTNNETFLLPIIEKSTFADVYQSTSEVYIKGRNFAEKIIALLDEVDENMMNGI